MKLLRRQFLRLSAAAAALPAVPRFARAEAYPARPVRIIVSVPPGGALDIIARLVGQWLSTHLGQPFVIENRPGGGANIGVEAAVRAPADGYTLLLIPPSVTVNAALYKLNFNFIRDMVPVAMISQLPLVLEVNLSVPAKTVPEFIAYAKSNVGKVNMASGGSGSPSHVVGELFKMMTGIKMVHVPYRGGAPALTDLMGGQVQVMFSPLPESIAAIRRQGARAGGNHGAALGSAAAGAERERIRAGLRGQYLARHRRAGKHAGRNRHKAQSSDQRRARRSRHQDASCQSRYRGRCRCRPPTLKTSLSRKLRSGPK